MSPSEVLSKIATTPVFKDRVLSGALKLSGNDPLGCEDVHVIYDGLERTLTWGEHRGKHPQSTRCYWSGKKVVDWVGSAQITIHFSEEDS